MRKKNTIRLIKTFNFVSFELIEYNLQESLILMCLSILI